MHPARFAPLKAVQAVEVQVHGGGTDAKQRPGDPQQHPGASTAFLSLREGAAPQSAPVRGAERRLWFNPGRKESNLNIVPGVFAWCSGSFPLWLAANRHW